MKKLSLLIILFIFFCCGESNVKEPEIVLEIGWKKINNNCLIYDMKLEDQDSISWGGDCFNGKVNGFGNLKKFRNNEKIYEFEGNFINGEKLGIGKQTYLNGSVYEGEFYFEAHGSGKTINPDGSSSFGIYRQGDAFTVVKQNRDETYTFLLEGEEISKEKAISLGLDKWSIDKTEYKLNTDIYPDLNVPTIVYYDKDWNMIKEKTQAVYYRMLTFISPYKVKDNLVQDFYISGERQNKYYAKYVDYNNTALEIRDGENIEYFKNGNIKSKYLYKNGKLIGDAITYWDDGTIASKEFYVNGESDGLHTDYWENGNIEKEINYVNGILNGERRYYFENGNIKTIQYSKNDEDHGEFTWFDENGNLTLKQSYVNDFIIPGSRIEFEKNGSGDKVYYESFGWNYDSWEAEGENYLWEVNNEGDLIISQNSSGLYKTKNIDMIDVDKTFTYELGFKKISGKNEWGTGMYFNYKDDDNFSKFIVSSDGYFKIDQYYVGIANEIKKWTKSSKINKSSGENKLKVFRIEEKTYFSVNGTVVHTSEESMAKGNGFGIIADSGEYQITSFELRQPFDSDTGQEIANGNNNKSDFNPNSKNWVGSGSGIVLSKSGLIATNNHVIEDANYIEVELTYDGEIKSFKARIIKTDEINDLAILKIEDENFETYGDIPYNFSSDIKKTGSKIYALGYPSAINSEGGEGLMGKEIKFTDGRISAKTGIGGSPIFYQTTAPLQGGNSGGPLFDEKANLVGINTAILESDKFENVSYSVKSRFLLNLIEVISEEFELPDNEKTGRKSIEDQIEILSKYVALVKVK